MKYTKTKAVLNQLVADLSQMSMIIHQTHWYMRGPNFLKLHPLMDEFMEEIDSQLDVISERLIALDGSPYSTLKEMAENTKIQDWPGEWDKTTPERLAHLVDGYRYLEDLYQHGIEVSDVEKDFSTQDIFIGLKTAIEKKIWMIQAELGSAPKIDEQTYSFKILAKTDNVHCDMIRGARCLFSPDLIVDSANFPNSVLKML